MNDNFEDKNVRPGIPSENTNGSHTDELLRSVYTALATYSNVHRGSGHYSAVTTHLYEEARNIVLDYLGLEKSRFVVIFSSPRREFLLETSLKKGSYQSISSNDIGLPVGVRATAVRRNKLPGTIISDTGGGTTRLISPDWVVWGDAPDKFEAGTPAIINVIAFAKALRLMMTYGNKIFFNEASGSISAHEILFKDDLENYSGPELLNLLCKTQIGRNNPVPTLSGMSPYINLDYAASTQTFAPVWESVCKTMNLADHTNLEIITAVRNICSETLDAPLARYDIIFTSNTTEAVNIVAESVSKEPGKGNEPVIVTTMMEHNSNDLPWRRVKGCTIIRIPVDSYGFLDIKGLENLLSEYNQELLHANKRIQIVTLSGASNVLGVFNDLEEISRIVHKYSACLLVDGAQMVAHRKVDIAKWDIDYFVFSGHKVYAPFGTGVLISRKGFLNSNDIGTDFSSGEENIWGLTSLGKSLVLLNRIGMDTIREKEQNITAYSIRKLSQINRIKIYGITNPESPEFSSKGGVIVFTLGNILSDRIARELALRRGIGIRSGCHCAHILIKHLVGVGPGLARFQRIIAILFPRLKFPGVARISFGIGNDEKEIDILAETLREIMLKTIPAEEKKTVKSKIDGFIKTVSEQVYNPQPI